MSPRRSSPTGLALRNLKCIEVVEYLLQYHDFPTTMIICSTREAFLENLQSAFREGKHVGDDAETEPVDISLHPTLLPTIHLLASSRTIDVAFTPTLPHLRAYLASYAPAKASSPEPVTLDRPGSRTPMLAIYGLLGLHRASTEHSVQGYSRTLAIAAEAANEWGMRLTIMEPPEDQEDSMDEPLAEGEPTAPADAWAEQVPLLNSSLALSNDRAWAGRTVAVGAVVAKWCAIAKPQVDQL